MRFLLSENVLMLLWQGRKQKVSCLEQEGFNSLNKDWGGNKRSWPMDNILSPVLWPRGSTSVHFFSWPRGVVFTLHHKKPKKKKARTEKRGSSTCWMTVLKSQQWSSSGRESSPHSHAWGLRHSSQRPKRSPEALHWISAEKDNKETHGKCIFWQCLLSHKNFP